MPFQNEFHILENLSKSTPLMAVNQILGNFCKFDKLLLTCALEIDTPKKVYLDWCKLWNQMPLLLNS